MDKDYTCEDCGADRDSLPKDCCDKCIIKFYLEDEDAPAFVYPEQEN